MAHPPVEWRFVLCADVYAPDSTYSTTGWETHNISMLDGIATGVEFIYILNRAAMMTFTVPSEDPRVNGICDIDGLPYLTTSARAVKAYRRVGESGPWTLRFAGRVWHLEDHGDGNTVQTQVTCYDPLKILEKRVCRDYQGCYFPTDAVPVNPKMSPDRQVQFIRDADALNVANIEYGDGGVHDVGNSGQKGGSFIIKSLITRTIQYGWGNPGGPFDPHAHCHIDTGGIWLDTTPISITFDQQYISDAIVQICDTGLVDLESTYLDVFNGVFLRLGARPRLGSDKDVTLSYAANDNSAQQYDRTESLDQLANYVDLSAKKQKGWNTVAKDATSAEHNLLMEEVGTVSDIEHKNILQKIAAMELAVRKDVKNLVTMTPTPEGAALPFDDYWLGDTILVAAGTDPYPVTRQTISGRQRIYGAHLTLDDDFGEYVSELLVSPQTGSLS